MPTMPINSTTPLAAAEPAARTLARTAEARASAQPAAPQHINAAAARHAAQAGTPAQNLNASSQGLPRGRVFALKDGSGFVLKGSDGNYYRLVSSSDKGLLNTTVTGFVEASRVNVNGGPVSYLGTSYELELPGSSKAAAEPAPLPRIKDSDEAQDAAEGAQALMHQSPHLALRSQANLDPLSALLLLR